MLMDRGELVILGTVHHYHSLLFVRTFSILTVGVGSCLMAWERPLYGTPPAWVYFFQVQTEYIWSNTKVHRQKSPSVIFGRTNMYTERCPISIDTKNKKNGSLCGTQSTSCAMTQTGYTRANIREIHVYAMVNKMRASFFVFHPKWHCGWSDKYVITELCAIGHNPSMASYLFIIFFFFCIIFFKKSSIASSSWNYVNVRTIPSWVCELSLAVSESRLFGFFVFDSLSAAAAACWLLFLFQSYISLFFFPFFASLCVAVNNPDSWRTYQ
jgi:hypothetical protein